MSTQLQTEELPRVFRIYFLSKEKPNTLADIKLRLFNCGVSWYQKLFGLESNAVHVVVQLGKYTYEVTEAGTLKTEYNHSEPVDFPGRLLSYWELDLLYHEVDQDNVRAAKFVLDFWVGEQTLDIKESLVYLSRYLFGLSLGDLPYTCTSLANFALAKLLGLEPVEDSHLPASLALTCCILEDQGYGTHNGLLPPIIYLT